MDKQFWHAQWQRNEIGFHRASVHPLLEKYWSTIADGSRAPVLVPLCGKSLDMHWLARRGHDVVGVEVNRRAIEQFFDEAGLEPDAMPSGMMHKWHAGNIAIFEGDFFEFDPAERFALVYDRAALIALPPEMRRAYLEHLARLLDRDASGLLITLEYDQDCMNGPPFSVTTGELDADAVFGVELLERRDVLESHPGFGENGLEWLFESSYRIFDRAPGDRRNHAGLANCATLPTPRIRDS